ncbi:MAG: type I-B CRISPR-associated protein Cas5b [Candidatus Kapaibacteriota bacterium]
MKLIVFDIWGDYAHFKKYYTTSSPLTFSLPPPPTIAGILGAIYGADKTRNDYLRLFMNDHCKLAVQILQPIRKVRMGINLSETKGTNIYRPASTPLVRTQIRTEFLVSPKFRIYFTHQAYNIYQKILENLIEHRTRFTVSLGLSELLANFEFVGEFDFTDSVSNEFVEIATPILSENLISLESVLIEKGKTYFKERIPVFMTPERFVLNYDEVIFEPLGGSVTAKVKLFQTLSNGTKIAFF